MTNLIDKDALVAEIKARISDIEVSHKAGLIKKRDADKKIFLFKSVLSLINTLEVKEVDLDGISRHYALNNSPWDDCRDEIQDAYKAGFELGMQVSNKAQKGEEV